MATKKPAPNRYFRIQNKTTGLYNNGTGAYWRRWTKKGKIWSGIGYLKAYLNSTMKYGSIDLIDNWEVVEYELVEVKRSPASDNVDILKILKT